MRARATRASDAATRAKTRGAPNPFPALTNAPFSLADTIPKTAEALRGRAPFEILSIVSVLNDILGIGIA